MRDPWGRGAAGRERGSSGEGLANHKQDTNSCEFSRLCSPLIFSACFLSRETIRPGKMSPSSCVGSHKQQHHVTFLFFSQPGNRSVRQTKRLCASSFLLAKGAHFHSWWSHYLITVYQVRQTNRKKYGLISVFAQYSTCPLRTGCRSQRSKN